MNPYCSHELIRTIKVSDPEKWQGWPEIAVKMFHSICWDSCKNIKWKDIVRIYFYTGDYVLYRDFDRWDLEKNWKWCKEWFWDRLPDKVNHEWLFEHGYAPF